MREKLTGIFSECLEQDEITDSTSPESTPAWDSLAIVDIVLAIEKEFGMELSFDDIQKFISFGEVYRLLKEKERNRLEISE